MNAKNTRRGITAAEFKTTRESLGLTLRWVSEQIGVKIRTVQYWETGAWCIPSNAEALLMEIRAKFYKTVDTLVESVRNVPREAEEQIYLVRYLNNEDLWRYEPSLKPMPTTCHAAILERVREELFRLNIPHHLVFLNASRYEAWLKDNNMTDSLASRSAWAKANG